MAWNFLHYVTFFGVIHRSPTQCLRKSPITQIFYVFFEVNQEKLLKTQSNAQRETVWFSFDAVILFGVIKKLGMQPVRCFLDIGLMCYATRYLELSNQVFWIMSSDQQIKDTKSSNKILTKKDVCLLSITIFILFLNVCTLKGCISTPVCIIVFCNI